MATLNELYTIDAMRNDDTAHHMARTGIDLSHETYASLSAEQVAWLSSLGLVRVGESRSAVHYRPAAQVQPGAVCFIADAPGTYGASDGRVWSSHRSIAEGRHHLKGGTIRGARVALHHGSLEPGTHWMSHMESIYPEVK